MAAGMLLQIAAGSGPAQRLYRAFNNRVRDEASTA
jgi:hypothetical protein